MFESVQLWVRLARDASSLPSSLYTIIQMLLELLIQTSVWERERDRWIERERERDRRIERGREDFVRQKGVGSSHQRSYTPKPGKRKILTYIFPCLSFSHLPSFNSNVVPLIVLLLVETKIKRNQRYRKREREKIWEKEREESENKGMMYFGTRISFAHYHYHLHQCKNQSISPHTRFKDPSLPFPPSLFSRCCSSPLFPISSQISSLTQYNFTIIFFSSQPFFLLSLILPSFLKTNK